MAKNFAVVGHRGIVDKSSAIREKKSSDWGQPLKKKKKKICCPLLNLLIVVFCYGKTFWGLGPSAKAIAPNLYFTRAANYVTFPSYYHGTFPRADSFPCEGMVLQLNHLAAPTCFLFLLNATWRPGGTNLVSTKGN